LKALADLYHAAAVFILETLKKRKVGVVALKSSHGGLLPGDCRVVKAFQGLGLAATGLFHEVAQTWLVQNGEAGGRGPRFAPLSARRTRE
jgi:hypothetical protein